MFESKRRPLSTAIVCATLMLSSACSSTSARNDVTVSTLQPMAKQWQQAVEQHGPPAHQLGFRDNLDALESRAVLTHQIEVFTSLQTRLAATPTDQLNSCERIDHAVMTQETELILQRAQLGLRYKAQSIDSDPASRLIDEPLGRQWYRHFLARWLGDEVGTDELFEFGEQALARSVAAFDRVISNSKTEDQALTDGGAQTMALFKERQARVWSRLAEVFPPSQTVPRANIARSDQGESFPVPGYYDTATSTFFYNVLGAGYDPAEADWLFLHEATPGHHYQAQYARLFNQCQPLIERPFNYAYTEGWAAYVETLGEALGLYRTAHAKLSAIEWDMVRSVRVVLDVGLNDRGWSDERALSYWHTHVRGQRDIAMREIERLKRWPGQAITYKYGAAVFESLQRDYLVRHRTRGAIVDFHRWALGYGPVPLSTLKELAGSNL